MDPVIKSRWVAALRSGKYKQTQRMLERQDNQGFILGNCCLGVLCREMKIVPTSTTSCTGRIVLFNGEVGVLNDHLLKKAGLSPDQQGFLAYLNDEHAKSFSEIADYIEHNIAVSTQGELNV